VAGEERKLPGAENFALLERRESGAGRRTGCLNSRSIDANYAGLVTAIARLPCLSDDDRHDRCQIGTEPRRSTGSRRGWIWRSLWLVIKYITTLVIRRSRQNVAQQDRAIAVGCSNPTH
jgi:hypothetical protein